MRLSRPLLAATLLLANTALATDYRYVTDSLEVTMRSGESTSHQIIHMLKSGQRVEILDDQLTNGYTHVRINNDKEGYVLNRFLVAEEPAKIQLPALLEQLQKLQSEKSAASNRLIRLQKELEATQEQGQEMYLMYQDLQKDYQEQSQNLGNTPQIIRQNQQLLAQSQELQARASALQLENTGLKDETEMQWFLRGAGVSLSAFLIGILVTRIRWKKRDSWGSL